MNIQSFSIKTFAAAIIFLFLAVVPSVVLGHSTGASVERYIDSYLLDVGYSPETPRADEQTRFDFFLYDAETDVEVPFTDIWVRIEDGGRLLFAGGIAKSEFGATGMTFAFPEKGTYTIFVRFENGSDAIVETEFALDIAEESQTASAPPVVPLAAGLGFAVGVALGAAALQVYRKRSGPAVRADESERTPSAKMFAPWKKMLASVLVGLLCAAGAFSLTWWFLTSRVANDPAPAAAQTSAATGTASVVLTEEGFEPSELTVRKGTTVVFSTTTGRPFWPASNIHPSHEIYPEFDPAEPVPADATWSFTFEREGTWNMHDHIRSYFVGAIHVIP